MPYQPITDNILQALVVWLLPFLVVDYCGSSEATPSWDCIVQIPMKIALMNFLSSP